MEKNKINKYYIYHINLIFKLDSYTITHNCRNYDKNLMFWFIINDFIKCIYPSQHLFEIIDLYCFFNLFVSLVICEFFTSVISRIKI